MLRPWYASLSRRYRRLPSRTCLGIASRATAYPVALVNIGRPWRAGRSRDQSLQSIEERLLAISTSIDFPISIQIALLSLQIGASCLTYIIYQTISQTLNIILHLYQTSLVRSLFTLVLNTPLYEIHLDPRAIQLEGKRVVIPFKSPYLLAFNILI